MLFSKLSKTKTLRKFTVREPSHWAKPLSSVHHPSSARGRNLSEPQIHAIAVTVTVGDVYYGPLGLEKALFFFGGSRQ